MHAPGEDARGDSETKRDFPVRRRPVGLFACELCVRAQDAEARQRERALLRSRGRVPLTNKQSNKRLARECTQLYTPLDPIDPARHESPDRAIVGMAWTSIKTRKTECIGRLATDISRLESSAARSPERATHNPSAGRAADLLRRFRRGLTTPARSRRAASPFSPVCGPDPSLSIRACNCSPFAQNGATARVRRLLRHRAVRS